MYREIALLGLVLIAPVALAAPTVTLDLADPIAEQPVDADTTFELRLANRLPKGKYQITLRRETIPIEPLKREDLQRAGASACDTLVERFSGELDELTDEKNVPGVIGNYRSQAQSCPDAVQVALSVSIDRTRPTLGEHRLRRGERLVVTVRRDEASWTFVVSPGERGEWRTYYGFTFLPNADEEFFSQQDATDPTRFIITEEEDRRELDFAPSILFTWLPASQRNRNWAHGLAAGLGFDLEDPIVFGGYALTYNENVAFTIGVVIHKQARLAGRFQEGQNIGEDLDGERLSEETYGVNGYFGVAFRFGSNPFAKDGE